MGVELRARDLRGALDVVRELNEGGGDAIVSSAALERLCRLVGSDAIGCQWGLEANHQVLAQVTGGPDHVIGNPDFERYAPDHPGCVAYHTGRVPSGMPIVLSDLASTAELLRTPLYVDFYRPLGIRDEMLCLVGLEEKHVGLLSLCRTRQGFSRRDRALVELLAPYVGQVLGRLGARTGAAPWSVLTPRERQVAAWVCRGATDREIARALGVSPRTVHKHLENMYRKLDLTHRTGLVAALAGLVGLTGDTGRPATAGGGRPSW